MRRIKPAAKLAALAVAIVGERRLRTRSAKFLADDCPSFPSFQEHLFLRYRSQNTKPPELWFRALLTNSGREVRFERVPSG